MNFYEQIDSNKRKSAILMIFFLVFIGAIAYIFTMAMGMQDDEAIGFLGIFGIFAVFYAFLSYFVGAKAALLATGAKEVPAEGEYKELHRLVENLAITCGLPKPKVCVIDDPSPNAFATGRDPKHAAIAVTSGLMNVLDRRELEGVVAHEMAHIRNYDIRFATLVLMLVGFVSMLADVFQRHAFYSGRSRNSNSKGGGPIILIAIVLSIISPLIAKMIQLAISRKREFLADASGVELTRFPEGLASALEKITSDDTRMIRAGTATAHLFISSPFSNEKQKSFFKEWFSTHPNPEERIELLRGIKS